MAKKSDKTTADKSAKKAKAPAKAAAKPKAGAKPAKGAKAEKPAKAATPPVARGPLARVKAGHGDKDSLVKKLVEPLAVGDQDPDALGDRLRKASNQKLLRLAKVVETVQQKYGGRDQLIAALGKAFGKTKDKDYLAKLGTFSLPRLLDMVRSAPRA